MHWHVLVMCTARCRCVCSCRCMCRCRYTLVTIFVVVNVLLHFMMRATQTIRTCPTSAKGFLGDLPRPGVKASESKGLV